MGDSRICSRGFPGSFVVHGALARRKFFIITTPTFILIAALIMIQYLQRLSYDYVKLL